MEIADTYLKEHIQQGAEKLLAAMQESEND
jgi:hypothetical protein